MALSYSDLRFILKNRKGIWRVLNNWLLFSKNNGETPWGSVTEEEEQELLRLSKIAFSHPGPIIEIGTLFGLTTLLLAETKEAERKIITVDNFSWNPFNLTEENHLKFTQRILRYSTNHLNTSIYDGDASKFYSDYSEEKPCMVFIDASHKYELVKKDIEWALSMDIPVISGHDYDPQTPGVVQAVDELIGKDKISTGGKVWSVVREAN